MKKIKSLTIKNFRCFNNLSLNFSENIILIKGPNGSGKTTILESLNYASTMQSFRTSHITELINFKESLFYIKIDFFSLQSLKTVYAHKKKIIKFDDKVIKSYKEISSLFQAISVTEDDLNLIKGGPEIRRNFLDSVLILTNLNYAQLLKEHKKIVEQRAALLQNNSLNKNYYDLWTNELCKKSNLIVSERIRLLDIIKQEVNNLFENYLNPILNQDLIVDLSYEPKYKLPEDNLINDQLLFEQEKKYGRNLIGAQLDDFLIIFKTKKSRAFASRGQQKLLVLIFKIVNLKLILQNQYKPEFLILLLDDFLTDLDEKVVYALLKLIVSLDIQIFISSPCTSQVIEESLVKQNTNFQEIILEL